MTTSNPYHPKENRTTRPILILNQKTITTFPQICKLFFRFTPFSRIIARQLVTVAIPLPFSQNKLGTGTPTSRASSLESLQVALPLKGSPATRASISSPLAENTHFKSPPPLAGEVRERGITIHPYPPQGRGTHEQNHTQAIAAKTFILTKKQYFYTLA